MKHLWTAAATAAALLALATGCNHHGHEGAEENEVKMSIDQVPAPVRAALMREAPGATIKTVDKEDDHGKTIYEADAMLNGQNWEIKVDPDGRLISKKLDNEENEKGEKNEKK